MATDVRTNVNDIQTTGLQPAGSSVSAQSTTAPNSIHGDNIVWDGNQDTVVTNGNSSKTDNLNNARTIDELYNYISSLCAQYGIDIAEAKRIGLMEKIAGLPQSKLLQLPNSEIQKHVECLKAALKKLVVDGNKIDLDAVARLANNYNIAMHTGWSIEGIEKATKKNSESLNDRIKRFFGKPADFDITKISKAEQEDLIYRYFKTYFDSMIKKGKSADEVYRLQIQDFGKLLINSTDEEKYVFKEAIKALANCNKLEGLKTVIHSFISDEDRTAFVDSYSVEEVEELINTQDCEGKPPTPELGEELVATITEYKSKEGITDFHTSLNNKQNSFYNENKEIIDSYRNKIQNAETEKGENLTDEEIKNLLTNEEYEVYRKELLLTAIQTGETVGTAMNVVISDEARDLLIDLMNQDAYDLPNYREFLNKLNKYIENHPNIKMPNGQDIKEYINTHTNGNLNIVDNDTKNGTTTELNAPVITEQQPQATEVITATETTTDYGFSSTRPEIEENINNLTAKKEAILNANTDADKNSNFTDDEKVKSELMSINNANIALNKATRFGLKVLRFLQKVFHISDQNLTICILDSTNTNKCAENFAETYVERQTATKQDNIYKNLNTNNGKTTVLAIMSASQVEEHLDEGNAYLRVIAKNILERDRA